MVNVAGIIKELETIGLNKKQAQVYFELLSKGECSPLELSRLININRTTLYRLLETLEDCGLAERVFGDKRTRFRAGDLEKINLLISQKQAQAAAFKEHAEPLIKRLAIFVNQAPPSTKVVYLNGQSGLEQLLWNTLKTKGEQVGYGYLSWNESVGQKFADKLRQEYVLKRIPIREIRNQEFKKEFSTEVQGYKESLYSCRYIPRKVIEIRHSTYIYNDVFAFFYWYNKESFCVEMYNKEITKTQKQIFEALWKLAKPVE